MKSNTAVLKKPVISQQQIEALLVQRETLDSFKKRYELLENSVKATEQELIRLLEAGADVNADYELKIRSTERRFPHWKEHYAILANQVPSAPGTDEILANTSPSVSKVLVVK